MNGDMDRDIKIYVMDYTIALYRGIDRPPRGAGRKKLGIWKNLEDSRDIDRKSQQRRLYKLVN